MFALLKKLRGPSPMTRSKLDDKAWNQRHRHTEDNTLVHTSAQALEFRLPSDVVSNESHDAVNERSKVAIEGTVAQPDTTFSSASAAIGQKYRFAGLTLRKSSSGSSRSPSAIPNPNGKPHGVLTTGAGLRTGLDVVHPEATGSAQEEDQPPKEASLDNPSAAHYTGHGRGKAVAGGDVSEQRRILGPIQAENSLLQYSKFGNSVARASPSPVDNTSLSIANRDTTHPAATFSSPVTLKGILKYRNGVKAVSRPPIGVTQQSDPPAREIFVDGDSTEEAESQGESGANLENKKVPRLSAASQYVNVGREENDKDIRKKGEDRYKNMDSSDISLEFEHRRNGHRNKIGKKARGQLPRGQHPYCSHRAVTSRPREYHSAVRSLPCKCGVPHGILDAKEWKSSPAEDEWDRSLRKGDNPNRETRRVTFAEPIVTEVRAFEEWWEDEYGLSDRYHSRGPFLHKSKDLSTMADDDQEIRSMGNLAQRLSRNLRLAASNGIANTSGLTNSSVKRIFNRLIAMAAKSHRAHRPLSKREKRQGEKQMNRRTRQNATGPSRKAEVFSTTRLESTVNLPPSSDLSVVRLAPEHQDSVDHGGEATNAAGKSESELAGGTADNPASTDSQPETSSTLTATPSQQYVDGIGDDHSSQTGLCPLRAFRDQGDSRKLRNPGPQYGDRTRWSPYHMTGSRTRHRPRGKESEGVRLMNDAIVDAALKQELALQADGAREVPTIDELPIDEAIVNAALEQEFSLQADIAREVPTIEKLSLHNAAGEAKIKEWWDSLYKSHASRAALAFSSGAVTRIEDSETAYHEKIDTMMSDPEEDGELSDLEADAEMSDPEDDVDPIRLTVASFIQPAVPTSGFRAGPGHIR